MLSENNNLLVVRKLVILKSLVDFVWIVTCIPMIGLLVFFAVYVFVDSSIFNSVFNGDFIAESQPKWLKQLIALIYVVIGLVSIYCLFIFRKTLRYFQQMKPFHSDVIINFYKIGYMLIGVGLGGTFVTFAARLLLKGEFKISLGLTPHIILICLGLFFMVLSEVFKVAKQAKEENELTV